MNWFGEASQHLDKFAVCSLSCLWLSGSSSCPQMAPYHVFNTCLSASQLLQHSLSVQRQSLDNKWRWQPIWCQLLRVMERPSLWAETLTSTLILLLYSAILWQPCAARSCAFDAPLWAKCGWYGHRRKSVLKFKLCRFQLHYLVYLKDICHCTAKKPDSTHWLDKNVDRSVRPYFLSLFWYKTDASPYICCH